MSNAGAPGQTLAIPLPEVVRRRAGDNTHPGLALDKYVRSWDPAGDPRKWQEKVQKSAVKEVVRLSSRQPPGIDLPALAGRRLGALEFLGASSFRARTAGPLTMHLARASALENAGICLHPIYGFAYLPGTGLKGMARAFAETVWLPAQPDRAAAWGRIEAVFGWAPGSDKGKDYKPPEAPKHGKDDSASSGSVVFHDAWPETWPALVEDIVNCHHGKYYRGEDDPGDWESPVPVCFLAVPAGVRFSFALAARRRGADGDLVAQAREWLVGALCHSGAGAKTAAGYGSFELLDEAQAEAERKVWRGVLDYGKAHPEAPGARAEFEATLELVTPAFLAGASQQAQDCDLRPATLRGLLRWWWRTLHAGHVDVKTLRAMEAAVWGDTEAGGAVRVEVIPAGNAMPETYDKRAIQSGHGLDRAQDRKTTQGLWYASYGMDETIRGQRNPRWFVPPGAKWTVRLTARGSCYEAEGGEGESRRLAADSVLEQARTALWLLCRFGGAGSKSRKGFGSFADIDANGVKSIEDCQRVAGDFRTKCSALRGKAPDASALENMIDRVEVQTGWQDPWSALDQAGFAAEDFAQQLKHDVAKEALGLPRKIHGPRDDGPIKTRDGRPVQDSKTWRPSLWLGEKHPKRDRKTQPKDMRHASPVHYHLAKGADGKLVIRVIAFPSPVLPDIEISRKVLGELLAYLKTDLERRARECLERAPTSPRRAGIPQAGGFRGRDAAPPVRHAPPPPPAPALPRANQNVDAVLIEKKTSKGGWKARHEASGLAGPVQNSAEVPAESKPGDKVTLVVAYARPGDIAFRWPKPSGEQKGTRK